jgi:hypothetical protein
LVIGGVGVVAVGAGAVFGALANSAKSSYEQHCGANIGAPQGFCDGAGIHGHSDASTKATLATVFVVGGATAVAAGGLLFFTAPRHASAAQVGVGPRGVVMWGRF